jgi:hypothetical protein
MKDSTTSLDSEWALLEWVDCDSGATDWAAAVLLDRPALLR